MFREITSGSNSWTDFEQAIQALGRDRNAEKGRAFEELTRLHLLADPIFATKLPERIAELEALPGWVWDTRAAVFENGLARLQVFAAREGHANVRQVYVDETGFPLGSWVGSRRVDYTKSNLSKRQISALEAVVGWAWDVKGASKSMQPLASSNPSRE